MPIYIGSNRRPHSALTRLAALLLVALGTVLVPAMAASAGGPTRAPDVTPVLAYYSLAYEAGSWSDQNADVPLGGRYSSDDADVMREQLRLAKKAGIDGFIVNWKNTSKLNARLQQLVAIADSADFKLAVNYQGQDAESGPTTVKKVATDLDYFQRNLAGHAAWTLFDKPVIIWSGIDTYAVEDVASVTATRRKRLLILASVGDVEKYQALAQHVDGNAYYWSSPDPDGDSGYAGKLAALGRAAHASSGLWIAPAAPGYGSAAAGTDRIVDRKDGATLIKELNAAAGSAPDAIGLISWNIYRDATQVEPSKRYGTRYLEALADARGAPGPIVVDFDSSDTGDSQARSPNMLALGSIALLFVASLGVIIVRNLRRRF